MSDAREPLTSLEGLGGDRQLARTRHPTSRRRPDLARMTARLVARLASEGHPWPDFAAAVIAERGRSGLDRQAFAGLLGVSEETLAGVEEGALGDSRPRPAPPVVLGPGRRGRRRPASNGSAADAAGP